MKPQNRMKYAPVDGEWFRPFGVSERDGKLVCDLQQVRTYQFMKAYASHPHLDLAECESSRDFVAFVKRWGPLRYFSCAEGISYDLDLTEYEQLQRWIFALLSTVHAVQNGDPTQGALALLLSALREQGSAVIDLGFAWIGAQTDIAGWANSLTDKEALREIEKAFSTYFFDPGLGLTLRLDWRSRKVKLEAIQNFESLSSALVWMVWQDVYSGNPVYVCKRCKALFRGKTLHKRTFCGKYCADRWTSREWARRRAALNVAREVATNGTQKAR